jgi:carbamoyltransferase
MNILGISAYYHDSAACLVKDGQIVAAAQEERFTRKKHDASFPINAVRYCLKAGAISAEALDYVCFYEKPFLKFERLLETYLEYAPLGIRSFIKAMPVWLKKKLWVRELIAGELGFKGKILFPEHHQSHAASAFFPSPFEEAAILTMDGVGEWATSSLAVGEGNRIRIIKEIRFPHSIGLLYSAFTYYTGFKVNSGEYKVMGLAPYGEPRFKEVILKELIDLKADGSFRLNMKYFNYGAGLTMTNGRFHRLFGAPPRRPESKITQREMDLARSIQDVTEEVMIRMARHAREITGKKNLCLAGGVALNCVGNGKILKERIYDHIWIQPAAGDAGGALGAALVGWHEYLRNERRPEPSDSMKGSYLGPEYGDDEIQSFLDNQNAVYEKLDKEALIERTADIVAEGHVVGWFAGRMEFGPRALGARSIIGDARNAKMQETMNLKIKFRESFRPFAPSVLHEKAADYFEIDKPSPYMLLVAPVRELYRRAMSSEEERLFGIDKLNVARSTIPAVTHVDYSARVQTVESKTHGLYYDVIKKFDEKYGCGVIVNTSFNVRGEPLVCAPDEAYRCFMRTHMDYLVLGSYLIDKRRQPELKEDIDWKKRFELD